MSEPLLDLSGLRTGYGRIEALHGLDVTITKGETVALVGANGAGKSTLLRVISGLQPLSGGAVIFDGQDLARRKAADRVHLGIVQVPEGRQVFAGLSVERRPLLDRSHVLRNHLIAPMRQRSHLLPQTTSFCHVYPPY